MLIRQRRLSILAVSKPQRLRSRVQITRDNRTQESAGDDEMSTMFLKMEASRALPLVRFQRHAKALQPVVFLVQSDAPHVNGAFRQRQQLRRLGSHIRQDYRITRIYTISLPQNDNIMWYCLPNYSPDSLRKLAGKFSASGGACDVANYPSIRPHQYLRSFRFVRHDYSARPIPRGRAGNDLRLERRARARREGHTKRSRNRKGPGNQQQQRGFLSYQRPRSREV